MQKIETWFDTSNFEIDRPLPKGKNKEVIRLMKGQIMKEFVGLRAKTYSHLKENNDEDKKSKRYKKVCHKKTLKFQNDKNCLNAAKIDGKIKLLEKKKFNIDNLIELAKNNLILKTQQRFKNEKHNVFTEVIIKTALCSNDDKRMLSWFDRNICIWNEQRYNICERKN